MLTLSLLLGPISVAVYIKDVEEDLKAIAIALSESKEIRFYVDFHLLYEVEQKVITSAYAFSFQLALLLLYP